MGHSRRSLHIYVWAVCVTGIAILAACAYSVQWQQVQFKLVDLIAFCALAFVAALFPISIPETDLSWTMTMPLAVSLFLVHGMPVGVVFSAVPYLIAYLWTERSTPPLLLAREALFNTSNFVIALACASLAYLLVGGSILAHSDVFVVHLIVVPLVVWTAVYNLVNAVIATIVCSLYRPEAWKVLLFSSLRLSIPNVIFSVPVSILFACLYTRYETRGILMLVLPSMAGRHALNLYAQQLEAYRDTITTLGAYMQHYHPYTRGHLQRVASLSDAVARQMGLPLRSLMFIRDAGQLHDIGKVGVNEEVLDKVGKLTDEDWAIIKQHPTRGAEILSDMKHLEMIVPWVRAHHERPDGRGYPNGLKQGEIPIEAAVIAVSDAFDAMTGGPDEKDQRSYRKPLTTDQAMDQLRYGAGTQFDARVVKAFMKVIARREAGNGL